jgi:hypothetical protein
MVVTVTSDTTYPTDKSIPPLIMITVMPSATVAGIEAWTITIFKLYGLRND